MRAILNFLWLTFRCIAFLWIIITLIILVLFAVGTEGEGYSWSQRFQIAALYAGYVSFIFGTLLAIWMWWQNWKVDCGNRKKTSRLEKRNMSDKGGA